MPPAELAQELVTGILVGIVERRPILVSNPDRHPDIEGQIYQALRFILGNSGRAVRCSATMQWPELAGELADCSGHGTVLLHASLLRESVQMRLVDALLSQRVRSEDLDEKFHAPAVVCTGTRKGLSRHLRNLLLVEVPFETEADVELLEVPEKPRGRAALEHLVKNIRERLESVAIVPDIRLYMQDIVLFINVHRLVYGGVPPQATRDFEQLVRILCVFGNLKYATPQIVATAARLILPLKIVLIEPEDEPTLCYGGDIDVVRRWLKNWDSDLVVETVIDRLSAPL